ncbi:MAG: hypothetical protein POH28_02405 [Acidocella sp.]|nr:hypothetical protein [Acidocella sp.]
MNMRRVLVLGPPGAGKSTLALALGARLGLPVHHLDHVFFRPGWVQVPMAEFAAEVGRLAAGPGWVIDGIFLDVLEPHLRAADTVIYLDLPPWVTLFRILRRTLNTYGQTRPDGPVGCPERVDLGFLRYAMRFNARERGKILRFVESFNAGARVLRGQAAIRRFLAAQPMALPESLRHADPETV